MHRRRPPTPQQTFTRPEVLAEIEREIAAMQSLERQSSTTFKVSCDSHGRLTGVAVVPSERRLLPRRA